MIRQNESLRHDISETLRMILVAPLDAPALDQALRDELRLLRDGLVQQPTDKLTQVFVQPPLRPMK